MKKRIFALLIAAAMLLTTAACSTKQGGEPTAQSTPADDGFRIIGINARIDGEKELTATEPGTHTAQVVLPEGMALDHWEIDGVPADAKGRRYSLEFTADKETIVSAVLRPVLQVTSINAVMQLLNERGRAEGPVFTEFLFEDDYLNEATGQMHRGGTVTVHVKADVPEGYEVDYWLINDVPYFYNAPVTAFTVVNLDETTVYEVVLKAAGTEGTAPEDLMFGPGTTPPIPGDVPLVPGPGDPVWPTPEVGTPPTNDATPTPEPGGSDVTPTPDSDGSDGEGDPDPKPTKKPNDPKPSDPGTSGGHSNTTPDDYNSNTTPDDYNSNTTPDNYYSNTTPDDYGSNTTPDNYTPPTSQTTPDHL